ncbi:hypothetical protein AMK26_15815 [Streptomyces sp. CB03234]|uniref:SAM-dependent methyltransferase n=1 Tax=Streptomyces sp. (strain CB03234) TaxID=1703937 RepID=UPI00093D0BE8|nr:methyltransferase domain-containing protein [Streptomyces sp. CB03234]OKK04759.1 hypothetical protein AMK26_15815 [Streptomyces sp. CB03234]DAC74147.1 TPA_exp: methyltransferase [Streptomyces sp. CB03234]
MRQQTDEAGFYNDTSEFLAELSGGSLHMGYWESPSDRSTMAEASQRLTDLMTEKTKAGPADRVLDIGCGTGAPAIRLARTTGAQVVGITDSPVQARLAVRSAEDAGIGDRVTFRREDAMDLPFPAQSFDVVWLLESLMAMPDRLGALRQAARVLVPGGRLALTDFLDRAPAPATGRRTPGEHEGSTLMTKLIPLADYDSLLEQAGLVPVETTDITDHTVERTLTCMRQKLTEDREDLVRRFGAPVVDQFDAIVARLRAVGLGYGLVVATRPVR